MVYTARNHLFSKDSFRAVRVRGRERAPLSPAHLFPPALKVADGFPAKIYDGYHGGRALLFSRWLWPRLMTGGGGATSIGRFRRRRPLLGRVLSAGWPRRVYVVRDGPASRVNRGGGSRCNTRAVGLVTRRHPLDTSPRLPSHRRRRVPPPPDVPVS